MVGLKTAELYDVHGATEVLNECRITPSTILTINQTLVTCILAFFRINYNPCFISFKQ